MAMRQRRLRGKFAAMARNPGLCGMVDAAKRETANSAFIMSPPETMFQKKLLLKLLIKKGILHREITLFIENSMVTPPSNVKCGFHEKTL
jgi:hypothetical protein